MPCEPDRLFAFAVTGAWRGRWRGLARFYPLLLAWLLAWIGVAAEIVASVRDSPPAPGLCRDRHRAAPLRSVSRRCGHCVNRIARRVDRRARRLVALGRRLNLG